jgi:hypothetical protein
MLQNAGFENESGGDRPRGTLPGSVYCARIKLVHESTEIITCMINKTTPNVEFGFPSVNAKLIASLKPVKATA